MAIQALKQIDLQLEKKRSRLSDSSTPSAGSPDAFSEALARAAAAIVKPHQEAAGAVDQFSQGRRNIHETLIAVEKADISLKYMMNVRNKLLDAYREVMQMGA